MDVNQRKDIIVFALILILAFLIGYNGIYKANLNRIDSLKLQIEEEKKKNIILGDIGLLDKKLQAYKRRFFTSAEITELLDRASELAKEVGIKIETFNPLPAVYRAEYVELGLKIPLRCDYHTLGKFLSLIESSGEFIWVKEIDMQKSTVTRVQEENTPKINLVLSGFYLKK